MSPKSLPVVQLLYLLQLILCGAKLLLGSRVECLDCARIGAQPIILLAGLFGYSILLGLKVTVLPKINRYSSPLVCAIHLALVAEMFMEGGACSICLLSMLVAVFLFLYELVQPEWRYRIGAVSGVVITAILLASFRPVLRIEEAVLLRETQYGGLINDSYFVKDKLSVIAFVKQGCPYCKEFKESYDPKLRVKFGDDIRIKYVYLKESTPSISRVPVVLVGREARRSMALEGLPSYAMLEDILVRLIRRTS